ncbi:endonuclease/exonuclease/phosphatase family domain-containing protein 1-like isoform X3 [Macrosteles quadrilineatus]|uniref:endonuclease/exonuclease/phosphatase family domain-containing protein 1-like isoform X3 n=1 Tax=Macrosteles quadrilineatus TaxID=74068 RepID=UPI0023E22772|nr:endonuclease/exonuclease/phosphatase family domain-containing protein 1-like isoform X3 [Macrosteles quadrilineatus]
MGQNHSSSFPGRRKSIRRSLRSPFPRRSRTTQSLSATFNYVDSDVKGDQLNLNNATAEELMTLPGVTRAIAQNIVEYRQAIGRFNKVEDLALVSGVGAEKLGTIRPEICVHRRKSNSSNQSSRAQSMDSLASSEGSPRPPPPVDINNANVFSLMTLRGVTQELAANIVDYRERRGPFNALQDLLRVRGMSAWLLSNLRSQVVVGPPPPGTPIPLNKKLSLTLLNGTSLSRFADRKPQMNGHVPVKDIFELLCAYSQRPLVDDVFQGMRDGRSALRLASWNLTAMTVDKIDNPGVKEVVCRTLLENRFSLVATQEVLDPAASDKIACELNEPRLRRVQEWRGKRGKWKNTTTLSADGKRSCGFLYDSETGIGIQDIQIIHDDATAFAILAQFEVDAGSVSLMNIHLSADDIKVRELCQRLLSQCEPDIAIGDFTPYPDAEFVEEGYTRILQTPTITNSMAPGTCGVNYMDNIYLNKRSLSRYTGVAGIVRQGLNHVAIPRGWQWGGPASEHCPVWCELYT